MLNLVADVCVLACLMSGYGHFSKWVLDKGFDFMCWLAKEMP